MDKQRDSNIELLRCVLMFMIVMIHFIAHNLLNSSSPVPFMGKNYLASNILLSFTECAVDCFVLISGYFGIKLSLRKIVLFLLPIAFYEFVISAIYYPVTGEYSINPFNYWFVKPYFALMLFSPILNKGLESLAKSQLAITLLILSIFYILPIHSLSDNAGKNIIIFIILYTIGFYIKHFYNISRKSHTYLLLYCICSVLIFCETIGLSIIGKWHGSQTLSYSYDSILIIASAIFLFLGFLKINLNSKVVNWVAASAFFVYIMTENTNVYLPPYSMYELLNVESWNSNTLYLPLVIGFSLLVFSLCIIIDKFRMLLFSRCEKVIGKFCDTMEERLNKKIGDFKKQ